MQKKQETADDIIAEMRGARTKFPFVYLMGEPDTPEVIDPKTKEIIEPRKINIRRVTIKELADRLKAALRRERGDRAKLREALKKCLLYIACAESAGIGTITLNDKVKLDPKKIIKSAKAALAAPPRNCDMPYNDRVEMYGAFKDWCNAKGHTMEPKLAYDAFEWLLALATKKEGGAK